MDVNSVFATGVTANVGDTYVRLRFLKDNIDLSGNKEADDVVADVMMSPELFRAISSMCSELDREKKESK